MSAAPDTPRPLLLGEAPSKGGDRYYMLPLSGRPAAVLCRMAGIPPQAEGSTYGKWTWALYERFNTRNLFRRYRDATPWSAPAARVRVRELLADLRSEAEEAAGAPDAAALGYTPTTAEFPLPPTVIVCVGRRVQEAVYGVLSIALVRSGPAAWGGVFGDYGAWVPPWVHGTREDDWRPWVVTIPHPSGLNRIFNDPAERARCGDVLRRTLALAAGDATVGGP